MNFSDILAIVATLTSIVGIPVTFVVARRARQRPGLRYSTDFDMLLTPTDTLFGQGLYMTLGDQRIYRISRTTLAFWNNRGDTINGTDILTGDPLRLQFKDDDRLLQTRIVSMSRKQIKLAAEINSEDRSSVLINFDFLDASDGG
jgi:hypothetical protein